MPQLVQICTDIDKSDMKGGQLLDYLVTHRSGIPIVNDVLHRSKM